MTSAPRAYWDQRDAVSILSELFTQAQALTTFGDRPLVVLAALSTNSVRRTIDSIHEGLLEDAAPAAESAQTRRGVRERVLAPVIPAV